MITDHNLLLCNVLHPKPHLQKTKIITRAFRSIDLPSFRTDISQGLGDLDDNLSVTELMDIYDTRLTNVLNKHAPPKEKSIVIRPQQPWFSDDLHRAKSEKRKAERLWRRTGLTVHRKIFKEERDKYNKLLDSSKVSYYNQRIIDCGQDSKAMSQTMNELLFRQKVSKLPEHSSAEELANRFSCFFKEKIDKIRDNLPDCSDINLEIAQSLPVSTLNVLRNTTEEEVWKIICKSPAKSCMLDLIPTWLNPSIDQHGVVILVMLDLSAAFDTIDHDILFSRMENTLGITGQALAWFKSYLSGRTLRIKIDKSFSELQDILWSVPQGSVLGPLLFLIYLLPHGKLIRKHGLELHIYADDTQLYLAIKPITQQAVDIGVARLEGCLTDIYSWMSQNKLKLNADKTEVLVLGTPRQRAKISVPSISVNGEIVKILDIPIGNLGSVFDPSMNMAAHVSKAVKSANYHLRNIGRIRKYLTAESTKGAVISLVTSRFDYCNGLLCGIPEELICKLQRVQNNAARVITLTKKYDHITPVLKELHWLPVRKRIEFKILLLAYKCLHGTAPSYLREMLKEYVPPRTLRSTSKNLLCEPRTNMKTYGDRSFSACAPKLWNELPNNIRAAGSVAIFKRQLKTHLFKDVFIK